ncbi:MAG: NAD-dependent epimerase/dehydratase family protein [Verrucomicrobium sp.]|nr:NAD-dependent epimerase/dehydratase family protein [Verrucomicrobium sp.]
MKILLTGLSSLSGLRFAQALRRKGHEVWGGVTRASLDQYDGLRRARLQEWDGPVLTRLQFGSPGFLAALEREGPFDLCCHHGAEISDYRNPQFDFLDAARRNTGDALAACQALAASGCRALLATGSYFEAEEGGTPRDDQRAIYAYGLSKTLSWHILRHASERAGLLPAKFVMPTPFGALEEPRLAAYLVSRWKAGETPVLQTPFYVRDHLPIDLMAEGYAQFCERVALAPRETPAAIFRPSGFVESVGAFAERLADEFGRREGKAFSVDASTQSSQEEPQDRRNTESLLTSVYPWDAQAFWDAYHAFYFRQG